MSPHFHYDCQTICRLLRFLPFQVNPGRALQTPYTTVFLRIAWSRITVPGRRLRTPYTTVFRCNAFDRITIVYDRDRIFPVHGCK